MCVLNNGIASMRGKQRNYSVVLHSQTTIFQNCTNIGDRPIVLLWCRLIVSRDWGIIDLTRPPFSCTHSRFYTILSPHHCTTTTDTPIYPFRKFCVAAPLSAYCSWYVNQCLSSRLSLTQWIIAITLWQACTGLQGQGHIDAGAFFSVVGAKIGENETIRFKI